MIILIKEFDFYLELQFFFHLSAGKWLWKLVKKKSMIKFTLVLDILENGS